MELRQLRYFVYVAELGSFSKGAEHLHVAQPALSRNIKSLEEELGVQLLSRCPRGVELTEAGRKLLDIARVMLRLGDSIRNEVVSQDATPVGVVNIGMPPSISFLLGPVIVQQARGLFPEIRVNIVEGVTFFLNEWLRTGRLELALVSEPLTVPGLARGSFSEEVLGLVVLPGKWPGGTVSYAEVKREPLIVTSGFRAVIDEFAARQGVELRYSMFADSLAVLKEMVLHGIGNSILPFLSVYREVEAGQLCFLPLEPSAKRRLCLARNASNPPSRTTLAVEELMWNLKDVLKGPLGASLLPRTDSAHR